MRSLAARDLGEEEQLRRHFGLCQSHQQTLAPARDPLIAAVAELKKSAMTLTTRAAELWPGRGKTDEAIEELLAALEHRLAQLAGGFSSAWASMCITTW